MQNLDKIHSFVCKILSENKIILSFKGRNSVTNSLKWRLNNPKLDTININTYAKFGENPLKFSQDTEWKRNGYGRTDNLKTVYPPYFICGGIKKAKLPFLPEGEVGIP